MREKKSFLNFLTAAIEGLIQFNGISVVRVLFKIPTVINLPCHGTQTWTRTSINVGSYICLNIQVACELHKNQSLKHKFFVSQTGLFNRHDNSSNFSNCLKVNGVSRKQTVLIPQTCVDALARKKREKRIVRRG